MRAVLSTHESVQIARDVLNPIDLSGVIDRAIKIIYMQREILRLRYLYNFVLTQ